LRGNHPTCPKCGSDTEVFSRIVGYLRPIKTWNDGKQQEWKDRTPYQKIQ
jgi:ribonucleoside-triphosphate reductase